jgi:membrane dipeptidase
VPYRLREKLGPDGEPTKDISQRTTGGDFDYPRAVEGGFDVAFMSIYIPIECSARSRCCGRFSSISLTRPAVP